MAFSSVIATLDILQIDRKLHTQVRCRFDVRLSRLVDPRGNS